MRTRVARTPYDPKRKTLGKAWRSLGPPTPDKAAWGLPLMYQYGETVRTQTGEIATRSDRLTLIGPQKNRLTTVALEVRT